LASCGESIDESVLILNWQNLNRISRVVVDANKMKDFERVVLGLVVASIAIVMIGALLFTGIGDYGFYILMGAVVVLGFWIMRGS
jgi:hypothetical protein